MFTTAHLPSDMRYDPENPQAKAVRGSGLTITCRHGDATCPRCIVQAARELVAATSADATS